MPKVNPFNLTPPKSVSETKSFTDPAQEGQVVTLGLRSLSTPEMALALEYGRELKLRIIGDEEMGIIPDPAASICIQGREVPMSESLALNAAIIERMQVSNDPGERYRFEELIGLAVTMPSAWRQIGAWANKLNGTTKKKADSTTDMEALSSPAPERSTGTPS